VQKASDVPRETLLGRRNPEAVVDELELTVRSVLADADFGSRFNLQPTADVPRNAFVPLGVLQEKFAQQGRANALFVGGAPSDLQQRLQRRLTLDDWGLVLQDPRSRTDALFARFDRNHDGKLTGTEWFRRAGGERRYLFAAAIANAIRHKQDDVLEHSEVEAYYRTYHAYLNLESRQLLLEPFVEQAALAAASETDLRAAPTLVYLANTIAEGKASVPYSLVAALDPTESPPLGPFLPDGVKRLADDQIVLVKWPDSPLPARAGDDVTLTYFPPEQHGPFTEVTHSFRCAGSIPLPGSGPNPVALARTAADPDLTPEFPGVTDRLDLRSWDPPFPFDNTRIKPGDENERFWDEYRTTPKAYLTLAAGQKLWASRFGRLTSVRLAPRSGDDLDASAKAFRESLLRHLSAEQGGLVFEPVKQNALAASTGGTDFSELFLYFSFFLIAAALLLVGLLIRLNLDRRASELGVLVAVGYRRSRLRTLLLGEGAVLTLTGALFGLGAAMAYAFLLVRFLGWLWPGGTLRSFLQPDYSVISLGIGFLASSLVSVLTIYAALHTLGKIAPSALLAGQTTTEGEPGMPARPRWSWWVATASLLAAVALLGVSVS
jgi:hypothetical protein